MMSKVLGRCCLALLAAAVCSSARFLPPDLPAKTLGEKISILRGNYNAYDPPPNMGRGGVPLDVQFGMVIKSMRYDIMSGHLHIEYWFRLRWFDERLKFTAQQMWGNASLNQKHVPLAAYDGDSPMLWLPDISIWGSVESVRGIYTPYTGAEIYPQDPSRTWNVLVIVPASGSVKCSAENLNMFPFEDFECTPTIAPWRHTVDWLVLTPHDDLFEKWIELPSSNEYQWVEPEVDVKPYLKQYSSNGATYQLLKWTVRLRRLPMYFLLNAILPMFMMVILSSMAFWIPLNPNMAGAGERMGFAITCMLTIVAVDLFTAEKRPMLSEETWLDKWISACMLFTLIPILETVAVFFMDAIFSRMQHTYDKALQKEHNAANEAKQAEAKRFKRYAKMAEDAEVLEAVRGKRVMRGVAWLRDNSPTGVCIPRGVDKWFRNLYPIMCVLVLGGLWFQINDKLDIEGPKIYGPEGNRYGKTPHQAWAWNMMFYPLVGMTMVMFFGALGWMIYEIVVVTQRQDHHLTRDDDESEDSDESGLLPMQGFNGWRS